MEITAYQCEKPHYVKDHDYYAPCRKCEACRKKRISEWTMRMYDEYSYYKGRVTFLTLTYDREHILNYQLRHEDIQKWLKRLRKGTGLHLRYYCAGEYGSETHRPHYHVLLYGLYPYEYLELCNTGQIYKQKDCVTHSDKYWTLGHVTTGVSAGEAAIRYVAKYINKIEYADKKTHKHTQPYQRCSQGMGLRYVLQIKEQLIRDKYVSHNGFKLGLPQYYKKKLGLDVVDYVDQINKKNDEIVKYIKDTLQCDNVFETDITLLEIYNRHKVDYPRHLSYLSIRYNYDLYQKKELKSVKKYLTLDADRCYSEYINSANASLAAKKEIAELREKEVRL